VKAGQGHDCHRPVKDARGMYNTPFTTALHLEPSPTSHITNPYQ
jgi:hypothetical protein